MFPPVRNEQLDFILLWLQLLQCDIEIKDPLQIKEGDQLTLLEPNYRDVDFSWNGKVCAVF